MVPEIWSAMERIFVILDHFLPFHPLNNPKNQNFEKMKKTPGHIIILHKCAINDNHMMYCSQGFIHAFLFTAVFPQGFSFFTVSLGASMVGTKGNIFEV